MLEEGRYLFLNSYFEAREKHIADKTDFDRMINGKDKSFAMEVLQDTDYATHALEEESLDLIVEKEKDSFKKDLIKMGFQRLADLYFLREDVANLRAILKNKIFRSEEKKLALTGRDEKELKKRFPEAFQEAKNCKSPAELDDYLTKIYLESLECCARKDKRVESFVKSYRESLENFSGKEREGKIKALEKGFLEENRKDNEGLAPILAYFMQKWRAEKFIKAIISGKEAGLSPSEIKTLIEDLRIL